MAKGESVVAGQQEAAFAPTQGLAEANQSQEGSEDMPNLPNLRGVVKSADHMFSFSQGLAQDAVQQLLLLRNRAMLNIGLETTPGTFLPFSSQKKVQTCMFEAWSQLPDVVARRGSWSTVGLSKDRLGRQMKTYYNKFQKETFGGREWMQIIIAIGTIDEDIVQCVNDVIHERFLCKRRAESQSAEES